MNRLSLANLPVHVARPAYHPGSIDVAIVHFGPGAFHRAHQAAYVDQLLAQDQRWGISAVSLRSAGTVTALAEQQGIYSLSILDATPSVRLLAPHREWIGPGGEAKLHARLAMPGTALVTATVTEKGYCLQGDGTLDFTHPDIAHDLESPAMPRSFPGWVVAGLAARRAARLKPFVTLSCDNLGRNGRKLGAAVQALAAVRDPDLARWIADEARFPDTMVDSITPASDPAFLAQVTAHLGCEDRAAVKREAFAQWVIERTDAPLPDFGAVGASMTGDVAAWERAKLRILNGAHSALAYLGSLRGHVTVADAMADLKLAAFVEAMVRDEVWPSLTQADGLDLADYTREVLARFRNPAIHHELAQIAWDGSQKLPYRLIATIVDAAGQGRGWGRLAIGVAGWMVFCVRQAGRDMPIIDPLGERLARAGNAARERRSAVPFLEIESMFPPSFAARPDVRSELEAAFLAVMENRWLAI